MMQTITKYFNLFTLFGFAIFLMSASISKEDSRSRGESSIDNKAERKMDKREKRLNKKEFKLQERLEKNKDKTKRSKTIKKKIKKVQDKQKMQGVGGLLSVIFSSVGFALLIAMFFLGALFWFAGLFLLVGLILGAITKRNGPTGLVGFILGLVGMILWVILLILVVTVLAALIAGGI